MTEAYAIANDQLRAERDAALARAEAAEQERDGLKSRLASAIASTESAGDQRADAAERKLAELRAEVERLNKRIKQLEDEHEGCISDGDLRAKLKAVTEERAAARLDWTDARCEVARLGVVVDELRAQLEAARQEATLAGRKAEMHERDADEAHRAVAVLQSMFHAAIKAAARTP